MGATKHSDPKDLNLEYETSWFNMFSIENGKIAEHGAPALKQYLISIYDSDELNPYLVFIGFGFYCFLPTAITK